MILVKSSLAAALAAFSLSLAAPVQARTVSADSSSVECLARTIYHEARGEGPRGQRAVGEVVINRVKAGFGKSVCGVTRARGQFAPGGPIREHDAWQGARNIAVALLSGKGQDITGGATYFHSDKVRPSWSRKFPVTGRIGSHVFYKGR